MSEISNIHDMLNDRISEYTADCIIELITELSEVRAFTNDEALQISFICKNAINRNIEQLNNN